MTQQLPTICYRLKLVPELMVEFISPSQYLVESRERVFLGISSSIEDVQFAALGVGIGAVVGLGVERWMAGSGGGGGLTAEKHELELLHQVVDGKDSCVTFEYFPYYLRQN